MVAPFRAERTKKFPLYNSAGEENASTRYQILSFASLLALPAGPYIGAPQKIVSTGKLLGSSTNCVKMLL